MPNELIKSLTVDGATYDLPTKTSELSNDSGFIASESDPVFTASAAAGISSSDITAWSNKSDFSGSYNDLTDKPSIPSAVTESTVAGWGFTKNTGTYSKPSGGIPKTDLATAVQTSLGKADSALQSYTETDPVFTASVAHGITSANITNWNNKGTYSKPSGGIPKTDLASAVQTSLGKADTALQSYTETDPVFTASVAHDITSADVSNWNNKSDFSGSYNDLTDKPTIPSAVTESTVSGWGFTKNTGTYSKPSGGIPKTDLASAVQTSLGKADTALQSYTETDPVFSASVASGITSSNISNWNSKGTYSKPSGGIPKTDLATAVQTSLGKADTALQSYTESDPVFTASVAHDITSEDITTWNNKSDFSGSYNDLTNKPTIPSAVTESTVAGWGFTKNTGTYSKPSTGIPKTDLASAVQTSLGKADTALQSYTETDPTVPSWAKASSKPTYTKSEVGLGNVDNVKQYSASNPPPYPVTSVNGDTGAVTVSVPTKVSQLTNDSNFYSEPTYGIGTADPITRPLVETVRANRLAFLPASQIIIEQTTDGGTTWTDAGVSDSVKVGLFAGTRPTVNLPLLNGERSTNCGLRVTITAMRYNVPSGTAETEKYNYWNSTYVASAERYCSIDKFWFWIGANGDRQRITVQASTGANPNNWVNRFNTDFGANGWSGSDWVKCPYGTFGGGTNQTGNFWNWRITFFSRMADGASAFTQTSKQAIYQIMAYGENVWGSSNNLMNTDRLYAYDANQNATFPAKVTATTFSGSATLTGTPTAPTASAGTNNTQIATTAFVKTAIDNAGGTDIHKAQVTIAVSDWSNNACTKTVSGVTASNTIVVGADPASQDTYNNASIKATSQGANSVTFQCSSTPSASVTVNILIFDI